eukprot:6163030-Amphidinium_carterae.2
MAKGFQLWRACSLRPHAVVSALTLTQGWIEVGLRWSVWFSKAADRIYCTSCSSKAPSFFSTASMLPPALNTPGSGAGQTLEIKECASSAASFLCSSGTGTVMLWFFAMSNA